MRRYRPDKDLDIVLTPILFDSLVFDHPKLYNLYF